MTISPPTGNAATDWLTAIGTVGATVLALAAIFRSRLTQPKLSLEIDERSGGDFDLAKASYEEGKVDSAWIRARVRAERSTATDVEVSIGRAILEVDGSRRELSVAAQLLRWSSTDPVLTQLHLRRGAPRHVDIVHVDQRIADKRLRLAVDFQGFAEEWIVDRGRLTLDLVLTSSNGAASFYTVVIEYDGTWPGTSEAIWNHLKVIRYGRSRTGRRGS